MPFLFLGIFLVSTSGPFIVMAHMDAFAVVFWRTALAAPLFLAFAHQVPREHRARVAVGSLLMGLHFLLWVKAFDLTDFASNLLLLVTQPVLAAVLGRYIGEPPSSRTWISVSLATAGLVLIAGGDFALGPRALLGDLMCILAGLVITVFYVITRSARAGTPIFAFMGWTMAGSAVLAFPFALASGKLVGYSWPSWGWLAGILILTTMGGHGFLNRAAKHVSIFALNIVIVVEPAIGIAMGALLFGERVSALQLAGGAFLAVAVTVGLTSIRSAAPRSSPNA